MKAAIRSIGVEALRSLPVKPVNNPRKEIIVMRPDHLGDLLFVSPGLRRMRRSLPDWQITLAVGPWSAAVAERNPDADEVIRIPFPGFTRERKRNALDPYLLLHSCATTLRARSPAAAVILRDDHWWGGLLARRAGIQHRFGLYHRASSMMMTDCIGTHRRHWVEQNVEVMDLAARVLGGQVPPDPVNTDTSPLQWDVTPSEAESADRLLKSHGIDQPFIVIHPGSGAQVKLWIEERWAMVASAVAQDSGVQVILTGDDSEAGLVARIAGSMTVPAVSLAGQTPISTLAAIYKRAKLVAGVDSGPLHLAVAVGTPSLHLFGPSNFQSYGPWGDPARHRVLDAGLHCPHCGDLSPDRPKGAGCMLALTTVEVIATMLDMLSNE